MSSTTQVALQAAMDAAQPQITSIVGSAKDSFMASFGGWVQSSHRERLEYLFVEAGHAKIRGLMAATKEAAEAAHETYLTLVASIETLGLAVSISAKAVAVALMKDALHRTLSAIAAIAGAVLKAVVEAVLPGAGILIGSIAGAGLTHAMNYGFGTSSPLPLPS